LRLRLGLLLGLRLIDISAKNSNEIALLATAKKRFRVGRDVAT
jgi:hypothetical protein